jgi:hypothetical protein
MSGRVLTICDEIRHRIPFWWWLTYDLAVALVIVAGGVGGFALVLGLFVLSIAVIIDVAEFIAKRPRKAE